MARALHACALGICAGNVNSVVSWVAIVVYLGISIFMGGETTPSRAVVQSAGYGYRLEAQLLKQEFNRAGPMLHLLLRYVKRLLVIQLAPRSRATDQRQRVLARQDGQELVLIDITIFRRGRMGHF